MIEHIVREQTGRERTPERGEKENMQTNRVPIRFFEQRIDLKCTSSFVFCPVHDAECAFFDAVEAVELDDIPAARDAGEVNWQLGDHPGLPGRLRSSQ